MAFPALRRLLVPATFLGLALAGCADLKSASVPEGADSGAASSGSASSANPNDPQATDGLPSGSSTGPGPHGSLPFGYCCTDDSQCRDRHCVAAGGSGAKMCEDACHAQVTCVRRALTFGCSTADTGEDGWCEPPAAGAACIPQALFQRGTRQVGDCCVDTGNGNAGEECEGNECISLGQNDVFGPPVCSQRCASTRDCPSGTVCGPFNTCDPGNFPYTCK